MGFLVSRKSVRSSQSRSYCINRAVILSRSGKESCNLTVYTLEIILQEGVYDADVHIELLDSAIAEGGRNCVVLCDALLPPVKMGNVYLLDTY